MVAALTQTGTAALIPSTALPQRLTAPLRPRTTCLWSWSRATSADLMRLYVPPAAALVVPIGFAAMTISGRVALPQPLTARQGRRFSIRMVIGIFCSDTVFVQLDQFSQILSRQCCLLTAHDLVLLHSGGKVTAVDSQCLWDIFLIC